MDDITSDKLVILGWTTSLAIRLAFPNACLEYNVYTLGRPTVDDMNRDTFGDPAVNGREGPEELNVQQNELLTARNM